MDLEDFECAAGVTDVAAVVFHVLSQSTGLQLGMTHLRHIGVFVDEPNPGHFHWVLHESTHDASVWIDLDSSVLSFPSWMDAFTAGSVELFRLVPDERCGPRAVVEDEDADPVG